MKSLYTRCAAALLCASALAACGGGDDGTFPLGGSISGLDRAGLVLSNQGKQLVVTAGSTSFSFTDALANDEEFEVTVASSPAGLPCVASNNKGRANYYNYSSTVITCTPDRFTLSGKISGLTKSGLVIQNGSLTLSLQAGATSFDFGTKTIPNGLPYTVTILAQPTGQTCRVYELNLDGKEIAAAGYMPLRDYDNIRVTCV